MTALLLGAALALTQPPFHFGWLAPVILAFLLARFEARNGVRDAFLAGLGYWGVHLAWLPASFAMMFGPLGVIPFVPLVLIEAALWALVVRLFGRRGLALLGGWLLLDLLLARLGPLAFPWGDLGYALTAAPGRMLAALGGVPLLTLVVLLTAWALKRRIYWALLPWALLWLVPLPRVEPTGTALLVQGAVDPLAKVRGESAARIYESLSRAGLREHPEAGLVVWPETAVPRLPADVASWLGGRDLLAGIAAYDGGYRNRVVWVHAGKVKASYDKVVLVPFGENFPWRHELGWLYGFFFDSFGLGNLADTTPGEEIKPLGPYGVYVCYESVFGRIARTLARRGVEVLVNVSNDAWFGPTFGVRQHFEMGRLRAVETGRWLLRAGNDGITAAIDPYGRVVAELPRGERGYLLAPYSLRRVSTPYIFWGDWPVILIVVVLTFLGRPPRSSWW
ncbi:apolipoprotein N-acyltransferase [Oceanithermus sp.]